MVQAAGYMNVAAMNAYAIFKDNERQQAGGTALQQEQERLRQRRAGSRKTFLKALCCEMGGEKRDSSFDEISRQFEI
jgi:hypothetical protein